MRRLFFFLCFSLQIFAADSNEISKDLKERTAKILSNQPNDYYTRTIERIGDRTIKFEAFVSIEADAKMATQILSDLNHLDEWILRNINRKPDGGFYYSQMLGLKLDATDPTLMHGTFAMLIPAFEQTVERDFRVVTEERKDEFFFSATSLPSDKSIIEDAAARLTLFLRSSKTNNIWINVQAFVKLRNWLLYEALPDRLIKRESGERIQIVLDNYQNEEERRRSLPSKKVRP